MTETTRRPGTTTVLAPRQASPGFTEATVFHGGPVVLDPFLALTDFHMDAPTFAPHPHAGFSAVTYMFRDSAGSFRNRDSLGDASLIGPGDLHWTQAAHGMMHEEIPTEPGVDCHGMQLFVNLRAEHKHAEPRAFHVSASEVPVVATASGATIRVVTGSAYGVSSPIVGLLTPVTLLDVDLPPGAVEPVPVAPGERALVLVSEGSVSVAGTELPRLALASFDGPAPCIELAAGPQGASFLVLAGPPIEEPIVFVGPFCMTDRADIDDAQRRFRAGEMGRLAPSF